MEKLLKFEVKVVDPHDEVELVDRIKAQASKIEKMSYKKSFTEEEMESMKEKYFDNVRRARELESELADLKDTINSELKPIQKKMETQEQFIFDGYEYVTEEVFLIPDYDAKTMSVVNHRGEIIKNRDMDKSEMQYRMDIGSPTNSEAMQNARAEEGAQTEEQKEEDDE